MRRFAYLSILFATVVEGGTAMTLGGFLAHQGHLRWLGVVAAGALGGAIDGQLWFALARRYGLRLVERRPSWQKRLGRLDGWVRRHPELVIVAGRFVPGLRTVSAVAAGLAEIPVARFTVINAVGATLYGLFASGCGYLFGRALTPLLDELSRYEIPIAIAIVIAAALWTVAWHRWFRRGVRGRAVG